VQATTAKGERRILAYELCKPGGYAGGVQPVRPLAEITDWEGVLVVWDDVSYILTRPVWLAAEVEAGVEAGVETVGADEQRGVRAA
jgi:hypothetical protein